MTDIQKLTEEQQARIPEFIEKWSKIALCTDIMDKERGTKAVTNLYNTAGLATPDFIYVSCPFSGFIAIEFLATLRNHNIVDTTSRINEFDRICKKILKNDTLDKTYLDNLFNYLVDELDKHPNWEFTTDIPSLKRSYFGGSLWSGYPAWSDFLNEVVGKDIDKSYIEFAKSFGYTWFLNELCVISDRPSKISLNERQQLHNNNEECLAYRSGWQLYYINGVKVNELIVKRPNDITPDMIDAEKNAEVRRVLLERFGEHKYLLHGQFEILDTDSDQFGRERQLLRKNIANDEPLVYVKVTNSSPELDDSFRTYFLRVHPELRPMLKDDTRDFGDAQKLTCHNAVASTFGKTGENYHPDFES